MKSQKNQGTLMSFTKVLNIIKQIAAKDRYTEVTNKKIDSLT